MSAGDLPESSRAESMVSAAVDIEDNAASQMVSYQVLNEMGLCS